MTPRKSHYAGMTLAEALREMADHHGAERTRHLSQDEVAVLERAAAIVEREAPEMRAFG